MSDEIAIVPKDLNECHALSKTLSMSALMPQALRKKPEDILAIVLSGHEMGLAPMQAIRGLNLINGKISMAADLMGAQVQRRADVCEYLRVAESTAKIATYETKRRGHPETVRMSFTMEQAEAAGLTGNATYKKYPDAMLRARALSAICRAVYPDLCFGVYDPSELDESPPQSPQKEHAAGVKAQIQAQIKGETIDGEVVSEVQTPTLAEFLTKKIAAAASDAELTALLPSLRDLTDEGKAQIRPLYLARKAQLTEAP